MIMISVNEARERLVAQFQPVGQSIVSLEQALDRVLAGPVVSPFDFPLFDNSSMDGFAVIARDVQAASSGQPVILQVIGDIPAGAPPASLHLGPEKTMRIMTGAPLPPGADAVVPVESTDQPRGADIPLPSSIAVLQPVKAGENVRPHGQDFHAGQIVLSAGRLLRPEDIGLLAMLGLPQVAVINQPRVALLSSGDELLPAAHSLAPGKIHDANTPMLTALLQKAGVEVIPLGIARDDSKDIEERLNRGVASGVNLIITSAGASVGSLDYARSVIQAHGEIDFWQVAMRPGKPVAFGHYQGIPILTLPGNPVSAFVGFQVFVRPVLARLQGLPQLNRLTVSAVLDEPVESDGRESYLRASLAEIDGVYHARLTGHQGSGNLLSVVQANALLIVPSEVKSLPAGVKLKAWML